MKMRQSLAQLEREFLYEAELDARRREHLYRHVHFRARKRTREREQKRRSKRFYVLAFSLIATAWSVPGGMFETLYLLLAWRVEPRSRSAASTSSRAPLDSAARSSW